MVLLRKTYRSTRISKTWDKLKSWGTRLLVGGLFLSSFTPSMTGCSETREEHPIKATGIWAEPYKGEILQDEEGNYYMAERFIVNFKHSTTQAEVESLIRGFNGRVTGHIPQQNAFEIEAKNDLETGEVTELFGPTPGYIAGVAIQGRTAAIYFGEGEERRVYLCNF